MIAALLCICLLATANASYITKEKMAVGTTTVNYPVRLTYIDRFSSWWPQPAILAGLGVPGYTQGVLPFNYIALAFWTLSGPADAALVWSNPLYYIGPGYVGDTIADIQANLKQKYAAAGVKLLISAFGATDMPTSTKADPVQVGQNLAAFANNNLFDGVDIDWEDSPAFEAGDGSGEQWLITLTQTLRANLNPGLIITHAPQAPYFTNDTTKYPKGAYRAVHQAVGNIIDFYNIQFYNQNGMYSTADTLFNVSGGWAPQTSVREMIAAGINAPKIVIGKPATVGDGNSGYMTPTAIDSAIATYAAQVGWKAGIMFWQYSSDLDGTICTAASKALLTLSPSPAETE